MQYKNYTIRMYAVGDYRMFDSDGMFVDAFKSTHDAKEYVDNLKN